MAYIFNGHLNKIRKWLFIFENIIEIYYTMLINYILFATENNLKWEPYSVIYM